MKLAVAPPARARAKKGAAAFSFSFPFSPPSCLKSDREAEGGSRHVGPKMLSGLAVEEVAVAQSL